MSDTDANRNVMTDAPEKDIGQKVVDNTGTPEEARERQKNDDEEFKKSVIGETGGETLTDKVVSGAKELQETAAEQTVGF